MILIYLVMCMDYKRYFFKEEYVIVSMSIREVWRQSCALKETVVFCSLWMYLHILKGCCFLLSSSSSSILLHLVHIKTKSYLGSGGISGARVGKSAWKAVVVDVNILSGEGSHLRNLSTTVSFSFLLWFFICVCLPPFCVCI